jgi:uncharacterized membrane protein YphA (DoxX/SURF4 family)
MKSNMITQIIAFLFAALFLYTGISKLIDYSVFEEEIAISSLLQPVAPWIARILPVSELIVSAMLLVPNLRPKGLYASLGLMAIFTIYMGAILFYRSDETCGCGGFLEKLSPSQHFILDGFFVMLALGGVLLEKTKHLDKTNIPISK